jgi:hypothetical protein
MSEFDNFLTTELYFALDASVQTAIIDVAVVGDACVLWFKEHNLPATADSVVGMVDLVLTRSNYKEMRAAAQEG